MQRPIRQGAGLRRSTHRIPIRTLLWAAMQRSGWSPTVGAMAIDREGSIPAIPTNSDDLAGTYPEWHHSARAADT